jgi:hypothetical protein
LDGIEDVQAEHVSEPSVASHETDDEDDDSTFLEEDSTTDNEDEYEIESCDCDTESEGSFRDDDEEEPYAWATFHNTPVITTVMERMDGTFYELLAKHLNPRSMRRGCLRS